MFFILPVLRVLANAHLLWPLSLTCTEAPKPHVNLDNGGLGDSGSCCLSAQWKERLSCNGSPVGSVCKLVRTAAVWGLPPERHIPVLWWLAALFGWGRFSWRLLLLISRWVCALDAHGPKRKGKKLYFAVSISDKLSSETLRLQLF